MKRNRDGKKSLYWPHHESVLNCNKLKPEKACSTRQRKGEDVCKQTLLEKLKAHKATSQCLKCLPPEIEAEMVEQERLRKQELAEQERLRKEKEIRNEIIKEYYKLRGQGKLRVQF